MSDRQTQAYRGITSADWADLEALPAVPDTAAWHPPEHYEARLWDAGRGQPKTMSEALAMLARRCADPTAPDEDDSAYDDMARRLGGGPRLARPLTAGAVWVPWLVDAARWAGLRVVPVPGWETRGHGGMRLVEGVVGHHTATPETAAGDYPSLRVVRDGRAGLAGPLANLGLGRDGTVYPIAAGCAWHAGASTHAGYVDLNDEYLGIEAEDSGDGRWSAPMLWAYPRLVAGLLHYMRRGPDRYISHRGAALPPGRKPDPAGLTDAWMRDGAAAVLAGTPAPAPSPTPSSTVPEEAQTMRYVNLDNPSGGTPERAALLGIDPVGTSIVMPDRARAWVQWACFMPFNPSPPVARLEWLVALRPPALGGAVAYEPRDLHHRTMGALELPRGCYGVEVVVRGLPKGAAVSVHLDGIGHA